MKTLKIKLFLSKVVTTILIVGSLFSLFDLIRILKKK